MATLTKFITDDQQVRLYVTNTTNLLLVRDGSSTPFAEQIDRKLFTLCCLLRGLLSEDEQRTSIQFRFREEGCFARCEISGTGNVRCMLSDRLKHFEGDLSDLLGEGAILSITKGSWKGGMFTGTIEATSNTLEKCFSDFFYKSEQLETTFLISSHEKETIGCMIQPLPFCEAGKIHDLINQWYAITNQKCFHPNRISKEVFEGTRILETYSLETGCECSREMFAGLLLSIEKAELQSSILLGRTEELECGICGRVYKFLPEDLEQILHSKEGG